MGFLVFAKAKFYTFAMEMKRILTDLNLLKLSLRLRVSEFASSLS